MTLRPILIEVKTRRRGECRSCHQPVEWAEMTLTGRAMPFNAPIVLVEPVEVGTGRVDMSKTTSHFATCPDAAKWRKR
jgi:hypothetical protein